MENLIRRSLTSIIFITLFLGGIFLGKVSFIVLCFLIMIGCLWEFYAFFEESPHPPMKIRGFLISIVIFSLTAFYALSMSRLPLFSILAPVLFLFPVSTLFLQKKEVLISSAITLWGIFYCVIPVSMFLWIGFIGNHLYRNHLLLGPIFFIWVNDTGAYIFGNIFGKRLIFEKVSPGKTWEGFFGGTIFTLILGYFIGNYFHELSRLQWIALASIVVVAGTLGDFVESLYKRELGIKDSGKIFPGHGGMLDRFDSFLMTAPFIYFFLTLLKG